MMDKYRVTICMPAYNVAATISETLDSLLKQSYRDFCIIVIDNASTDDTVDVVRSYQLNNEQIFLIENNSNIGGDGNYTKSIQSGVGEYTAIYHADDIYHPEILAEQVARLDGDDELVAVFSRGHTLDKGGANQGDVFCPREVFDEHQGVLDLKASLRLLAKYGNFFMCPTMVARTDLLKKDIRYYDSEHFSTSADLDIWIRLLAIGKLAIIDRDLFGYRLAPQSFTYNYLFMRTTVADMYKVLDYYVEHKYREILSERDLCNYDFLKRKEMLSIAVNHFINGDFHESKCYLSQSLDVTLLFSYDRKKEFLKMWGVALGLKLLLLFKVDGKVRDLVRKFRFGR